jgi:hypothetical protein
VDAKASGQKAMTGVSPVLRKGVPALCRDPERLQQLVSEYQAGIGCKPLGQRYGASRETIRRALRCAGVEVRASHMSGSNRARLTTVVAEAYRAGRSATAIARDMKCDRKTIYRALQRAGCVPRGRSASARLRHQELTPALFADLRAAYDAGGQPRKIASAFGCRPWHVYLALRRTGGVPRGRAVSSRLNNQPRFEPSADARIAEEYVAGLSLRQLAARHGSGILAIKRALARAGVPLRSKRFNDQVRSADSTGDSATIE